MTFDDTSIGTAHANLLLDTQQYQVELDDVTDDAYSQVDSEGQMLAFKEMINHCKNAQAIWTQDGCYFKEQ
jgi:hypothetical protein